ncbi:MAG: T9SS type A sorting domain-containing protein, partial [Aureispira sp.]|nr:T9SS type A sorting domain-containing protein [Aureispira sp.]
WTNGQTYTSDNITAMDTIVGGAANGCDSITTLNLTINTPAMGTDTQVACNSYTWTNGQTYTSDNITAMDTIVDGAANGCDSITTLNLTINTPANGTDNQVTCDSLTWIDGVTYTSNNSTAMDTIVGGAANGCDSIVTLNLTITPLDTTISYTDSTITANASGATYQWIDCDNSNTPVVGATNQIFAPSAIGNYACIVNNGSCSDTSACAAITTINVHKLSTLDMNIYPNPAQSNLTIDGGKYTVESIIVYDFSGRVVKSVTPNVTVVNLAIEDLPVGIYGLKLLVNKQTVHAQFIKN